MDFAEREQQKKRHLVRVILAEVAMVLAVIFIVVITLLITMGFFVTSDGRIEQTGLIQIHSIPTGASVTIDGETIFSRTNLSRSLTAGEHHLKLSRDGYDTWAKTVKMYSGLLIRLYYPRLFLERRTPEAMLTIADELEFYSVSSERNFILYATTDSPIWQLVNIASDTIKTTSIDLADILPSVEQQQFTGHIASLTWNAGGDTVLAAIDAADTREWLLINLKNPDSSLNLTRTFGFNFDQVELINDTTNQLFVLENHHLRRIDIPSRQISGVLLDEIETFSSQGSNLLYLTLPQPTDAGSIRELGAYRDGESHDTILTSASSDAHFTIALARYYDNDYLAYTIDDRLFVYQGSLPSYNESAADPLSSLEPLIDAATLTEIPATLTASPDNGYIIAQRDQALTVVDLEIGDLYAYDAPESQVYWLDAGMFYSVTDQELTVWDYDGSNSRILVATATDNETSNATQSESNPDLPAVTTLSDSPLVARPIVITSNNKWLYYLTRHDDTYVLTREQIWD